MTPFQSHLRRIHHKNMTFCHESWSNGWGEELLQWSFCHTQCRDMWSSLFQYLLPTVVDCPTQLTLVTWICQLSRRWGLFKRGVKCLEPPCGQEKQPGTFFCNIYMAYQWIWVKKTAPKKFKNLLKQPFLQAGNVILKTGSKHFTPPPFAVATACCVLRQIPVRNMKEHCREIC